MATPTIAGTATHSFISLEGAVDPSAGEQLEQIRRPNVDGVAFRQRGKMGKPYTMIGTLDLNDGTTSVPEQEILYKAEIGMVVSVTTGNGDVYGNQIVLDAKLISDRAILTPVGGVAGTDGTRLVKSKWRLQSLATT
jgi:hypothetical protein